MLVWLRFSLNWGVLSVIGVAALVLGLLGWYQYYQDFYSCVPAGATREAPGGGPLDILYWTLMLFTGESAGIRDICANNYPLRVARVLAPLATFGGLIRVFTEFMSARLERWIIRRKSDHVLVCGLGARGRAFAVDRRTNGRDVVAIEAEVDESVHAFCDAHDIRLVAGDGRDPETLREAAAGKAEMIIVVTGDDNDNLTIARRAREIAHEVHVHSKPVTAYVSINHPPLWREIIESDVLSRRDDRFAFEPFSLPSLAARALLWNEPIYAYADMMDQGRVHAVLIGLGAYGESLLAQIGRVCVYKDFEKPAVTVLDPDPAACRQVLKQHLPELEQAVYIDYIAFDSTKDVIDHVLLRRIEQRAPVTAVFVCLPDDQDGLHAALYAQKAMRRLGGGTAPVFVRLTQRDGVVGTPHGSDQVKRLGDEITAFGVTSEMCKMDFIAGDLEIHAREIHEDYLKTRAVNVASAHDPARSESAEPWPTLRETYREANRRAADHIKTKLASVGAWQPAGTSLRIYSGFEFPDSDGAMEKLAKLEHRAWCAGYYLDGWQFGKFRDNRRKLHDNLVPYDDLSDDLKAYDRSQISRLRTRLRDDASDSVTAPELIRADLWVGLVGRNHVTADVDEWVQRVLTESILPNLIERHRGKFFTIVSPLAPGLDLTMTRTAMTYLAEKRVPHCLLVVEGVPELAMIQDFVAGGGDVMAGPWASKIGAVGSKSEGKLIDLIAEERASVMKMCRNGSIVDLTERDKAYSEDEKARRAGYARANEYMIRKCAEMFFATEESAERKDGGTKDALESRREFTAPSDAWPDAQTKRSLLIDLEKRDQVWHEP